MSYLRLLFSNLTNVNNLLIAGAKHKKKTKTFQTQWCSDFYEKLKKNSWQNSLGPVRNEMKIEKLLKLNQFGIPLMKQ